MSEPNKPDENKPTINLEVVQKYINENEDAKEWLHQHTDLTVTKALTSYEEKFMTEKFPALLQEEVDKRLPAPETEEQKRLKELEIKFADKELEANRNRLTTEAMKYANEKKIPNFIVDYSIKGTYEDTVKTLDKFADTFNKAVDAETQSRMAGQGRKIPINETKPTTSDITLDNLKGKSSKEILENKEILEELMEE